MLDFYTNKPFCVSHHALSIIWRTWLKLNMLNKPTTSIFSSSFSFFSFSFSFFLALAVMDRTAVETWINQDKSLSTWSRYKLGHKNTIDHFFYTSKFSSNVNSINHEILSKNNSWSEGISYLFLFFLLGNFQRRRISKSRGFTVGPVLHFRHLKGGKKNPTTPRKLRRNK